MLNGKPIRRLQSPGHCTGSRRVIAHRSRIVRVRSAQARLGWPTCGVAGSQRRARGAATRRLCALCSHLKLHRRRGRSLRTSALPCALRARRGDRRSKGLHLSPGCAAWPRARDVLNNARTNFSESLSDSAKPALSRDWCLEWCRAQDAIQ